MTKMTDEKIDQMWALSRLHTHRVQVEKDTDNPLVTVNQTWEGPALIVGEQGENILAVKTATKRVVISFFREEDAKGGRAECALALEEAGREFGKWDADVHVFELERLISSTPVEREVQPGARIGMLACAAGTKLDIELLNGT